MVALSTGGKIALVILLLLSAAGYLLLYTGIAERVITFTAVSFANSVFFLLIIMLLHRSGWPARLALPLIAVGILFRAALLPLPVTLSDDIYRYLWDGKLVAEGFNPFQYAPNDPALTELHTDDLPAEVNFPHLRTIYPAFAQVVFTASYLLFGESITGFKAILLVFELLTLLLLFLLTKRLNRSPAYAAVYALAPLPVMQFMGDGHLDAIGITMLALFLYLWHSGRKVFSYLALGLSVLTKLVSGLAVPLLFRHETGLRRWYAPAVPLLMLAAGYLVFTIGGVNPLEELQHFSKHWMFNGSVFKIFLGWTHHNQEARSYCTLLFLISAAAVFFTRKELVHQLFLLFMLFFLLNPTVHVWYVVWIAVLLPLHFRWSGLVWVVTVNLANYTYMIYHSGLPWVEYQWITLVQYVPVYALFLYEAWKKFPMQAERIIGR